MPSERELSMVFQPCALYPHMCVAESVGFALKTASASKAEIDEKVGNAADVLKPDAFTVRCPKVLPGGQSQRVAIGRAIGCKPKGFPFDEPLFNLDASLRVNVPFEIARLHKVLETTIFYVTHDQIEAMTRADRVVVLKDELIMQVGTPRELYERPDNVFVAQFICSLEMNLMACGMSDDRFTLEGGRDATLGSDARKGAVQPAICPEHIAVVDRGTGLARVSCRSVNIAGRTFPTMSITAPLVF